MVNRHLSPAWPGGPADTRHRHESTLGSARPATRRIAGLAAAILGAGAALPTPAGWTIKDDFSDLPFSVRYFAGGDGSVRGYDYKSLGPTDDDGDVVGGANKLVGSIEFDAQIYGNWSAAVFADSGNAFNSFRTMSLKTSVGTGIRWYSPLGPVRFDVAFPLDSDASDSWRIHISLGPDL